MKKLLFTLLLGISFTCLISAQEENEWLYKIAFAGTENCIDSLTCYEQILIEVNMVMIPDSSNLVLKIGNTPGGSNIFSRQLLKSAGIFTQTNVVQDSVGNAVISLGEYIVDEQFYVDMEILSGQE
jgi:hypothetical protein